MKNKRLIIGLLFSVLLLIPIVSAEGAWDTLDKALNDFGRALLNDNAEIAAEAVNPGKIWVPVLVLFFLVFSIIASALNFVPMFKEEQGRRMRIIIGLVFGLSAIQFAYMYSFFVWFGVWMWILIIFIIVALFFIGWGGFSTAWTQGAGEAAAARAEKYTAIKAEKEAETAMEKEKRERSIQRAEFAAEDKELRALRKDLEKAEKAEKTISGKLEYALGLLQRIKRAGAGREGSPELNQALQRVIDVGIKPILPTVRQALLDGRELLAEGRKLGQLEIVGGMAKKSEAKFIDAMKKHAPTVLKKNKLAKKEEKNVEPLCKRLKALETRRKALLAELINLEKALNASNQNMVNLINGIIPKLQANDIDAGIAEINKALQIDEYDHEIIGKLEAIAAEYLAMTEGELKVLVNIHEDEDALRRALNEGVNEVLRGYVPGHP